MSRTQANEHEPPIQYATARDGVRISYVHHRGSGPPFLQIRTPGAPPLHLLSSISDPANLERFRRGRSAVIFDWRGTSRSGPISDPLRIEDLAADLDAVIGAVGGPVDASIFGRACFAACLHASHHPDLYRSIRIESGALRPGESWQGRYNRPGWEADYSEHLQGLARHYFGFRPDKAVGIASRWESGVPASSFAAYLESEQGIDLTEVLPRIPVPTWVTAHLSIDYEPATKIAALLPNSTLTLFDPGELGIAQVGGPLRDEWDRHLGSRIGDPPSSPLSEQPAGGGELFGERITDREHDVLQLVATAATNREISTSLGIAEGTVKRHISNLLRKTGLKNRRQLMRFADRLDSASDASAGPVTD